MESNAAAHCYLSVVLQELHASQRELVIQTEEKSQLESRFQKVEVEHNHLLHEKTKTDRLVMSLKSELRLLKLQVRSFKGEGTGIAVLLLSWAMFIIFLVIFTLVSTFSLSCSYVITR